MSIYPNQYRERDDIVDFVVPDGVDRIGAGAFESCSNLVSVTIPNTVVAIDMLAFGNCVRLKSVIIPSSVTSIGNSAFSSCLSLESVVIPDSVTYIGTGTFRNCSQLTNVTMSSNVRHIAHWAFADCVSLSHIVLPEDAVVEYEAFKDAGLKLVTSVWFGDRFGGRRPIVDFRHGAWTEYANGEDPDNLDFLLCVAGKWDVDWPVELAAGLVVPYLF